MTRRSALLSAAALMCISAVVLVSEVNGKSSRTSDGKSTKLEATNKTCPVLGRPVFQKLRVEYQGQYVYFCCVGCPGQFLSDPARYIARMSPEDQEAIKMNEKCPITGNPINKEIWVESEGRKVYFCRPSCVVSFKETHKVVAASKEASGS